MDHHYGRREKLDSADKVGERIVTKSEKEGRDTKGNALDQKYLQSGEEAIKDGRENIHGPPCPFDEVVLVGHNTSVQEDIGDDEEGVELVGRKVKYRLQEFLPGRVAHLEEVVQEDKAQGLPDGPAANSVPDLTALISRGPDGGVLALPHLINKGQHEEGDSSHEDDDSPGPIR